MRKPEDLVKYQVVFMKPIRILYNLVVVIFTTPPQTWKFQQCVPVLLNIMRYHTGNVCYIVVISAQVLSYTVSRQINIKQTSPPK